MIRFFNICAILAVLNDCSCTKAFNTTKHNFLQDLLYSFSKIITYWGTSSTCTRYLVIEILRLFHYLYCTCLRWTNDWNSVEISPAGSDAHRVQCVHARCYSGEYCTCNNRHTQYHSAKTLELVFLSRSSLRYNLCTALYSQPVGVLLPNNIVLVDCFLGPFLTGEIWVCS